MTFWVTSIGTFGCPSHFAGVQLDPATTTVVLTFTLALTSGCDTTDVPDSFLVTVDRDRLPAAPFRLQPVGPEGRSGVAIGISP